MKSRIVGLAALLVLVGVGQSVGSIVLDLSEGPPLGGLGDAILFEGPSAFATYSLGDTDALAWGFEEAAGYGPLTSMWPLVSYMQPDAGVFGLALGEVDDLQQPGRPDRDAEIPFFTAPEPATLAIWSILGGLGFGLGWWRGRRRVAAAGSSDTTEYEPPDRNAWPEGTTEVILNMIDRGRLT